MPTSTFLNLPPEKRERLLKAAKNEFSRVPLGEASINRIIQEAEIPRGSFYMYFEDKRDLLYYILEDSHAAFLEVVRDSLMRTGGDIFTAYTELIDFLFEQYVSEENLPFFKNVFFYMLTDMSEHQFIPMSCGQLVHIKESFYPLIDTSTLRVESREDMDDIFDILVAVSRQIAAETLMKEKPIGTLRASLTKKMNILKHGMLKQ